MILIASNYYIVATATGNCGQWTLGPNLKVVLLLYPLINQSVMKSTDYTLHLYMFIRLLFVNAYFWPNMHGEKMTPCSLENL